MTNPEKKTNIIRMPAPWEAFMVEAGKVKIRVYPFQLSGKWYAGFDCKDDRGRTRRAASARADTLKQAKEKIGGKARAKCREINNGSVDLANLQAEQVILIRHILALDPPVTIEDIDQLQRSRRGQSMTVREAATMFLKQKKANQGKSRYNYKNLEGALRRFCKQFGDDKIGSVAKLDIDTYILGLEKQDGQPCEQKTKSNQLQLIKTFFNWAEHSEIIAKNPAAKADRPIVPKATPTTYSPDEFRLMLESVSPEFAPWLVLAGFCGIRLEELYTGPKSKQQPLLWEHIRRDEGIIEIPEATKTGRRIIPIPDAVPAWLEHHCPDYRSREGRVCEGRPPHKGKTPPEGKEPEPSETGRLGELVGGWKRNALRHSALSYNCAIHGAGKTAEWAGNSEAATRKNYRDAKSQAEAEAWFALRPELRS